MPASVSGASSYAPSVASSTASSHQRLRKLNQQAEGGDDDGLAGVRKSRSSLEHGAFGVMFTLSKESNEMHIRIRWVLLKILLDGWQLFTTVVHPGFQPWDINPDGRVWSVVGVLNFTWLADIGYGAYLALLYAMVVLLSANVLLCVWVAWCFKEQKFPVVWPIKVLRVFSSVFFHAFDVASLNLLQLGISCRFTGPEPRMVLDLFPAYSCSTMPQLAHAVVSGVSLALFIGIALLLNMAEVEVNPTSRRPMALGHSGSEVFAFAIKALMTLVNVAFGWPKVASCISLALAIVLAYQYLRWCAHLVPWVNYLKSGIAIMVVYAAAMGVVLVFNPGVNEEGLESFRSTITLVMLGGLAPAFLAGAVWCWWWLRYLTRSALHAFKTADPYLKIQDIYPFDDPRDVEIVARCARVWKDHYTLEPAAAAQAHTIIKAGLALFPESAYMALLHANFMIEVLGVSQSGQRQVEAAARLNPGMVSRFMIFTRQQQATQKAAGNSANGGASMDLLGYVEFQRKQRMVVRLHKEALQAMCSFWKALDAHNVSFSSLSKALSKIETGVSQAQTAYRVVLETYGNSPKLVRLYAKFLETIKNDPWGAAEYYAEAERLEQAKNDDARGPLLPDGTPLGRMDELPTAVLVTNATGEIQMANKEAHTMFGYKRGMLDAKPMSTLLTPTSGGRMAELLEHMVCATSGILGLAVAAETRGGKDGHDPEHGKGTRTYQEYDAASGTLTVVAVGLHRERVALPVRISVSKASGVGEDSTLIVMIEPLPATKDTAVLWVANNGTVAACDPQFVATFGFTPNDILGARLSSILALAPPGGEEARQRQRGSCTDDGGWGSAGVGVVLAGQQAAGQSPAELLHRLLDSSASTRDKGLPCRIVHKYDSAPLACTVAVAGTEAAPMGAHGPPLHEVRIKRASAEPHLIMIATRKGVIKYASPELALKLSDKGAGGGLGGVPAVADAAAAGAAGAEGVDGDEGGRLPPGMAASELLSSYTLQDFLPPFWKDVHTRLLRDTTALTPAGREALSCRKAAPGATLELRTARGKPLYARVAVTTTEMGGEAVHLMRFARSSLEAAMDERRVRLVLAPNGSVTDVSVGSPVHLFGFKAQALLGRVLWDVVEGLDFAGATGSSARGARNGRAYEVLLSKALSNPGQSWRVSVVPPAGSGGPLARAGPRRPAVMQVNVQLPPVEQYTGQEPTVYVDLWPATCLTAVLELDGTGRVTAINEEHTRPVGLIFGHGPEALLGEPLGSVINLPPGRRPNDLLSLHGGARKSSLKVKQKEVAIKVGPVHVLPGVHADGQPLSLEVQVVGKPGNGMPVTLLIRLHGAHAAQAAFRSSGMIGGFTGVVAATNNEANAADAANTAAAATAAAEKSASMQRPQEDDAVREPAAVLVNTAGTDIVPGPGPDDTAASEQEAAAAGEPSKADPNAPVAIPKDLIAILSAPLPTTPLSRSRGGGAGGFDFAFGDQPAASSGSGAFPPPPPEHKPSVVDTLLAEAEGLMGDGEAAGERAEGGEGEEPKVSQRSSKASSADPAAPATPPAAAAAEDPIALALASHKLAMANVMAGGSPPTSAPGGPRAAGALPSMPSSPLPSVRAQITLDEAEGDDDEDAGSLPEKASHGSRSDDEGPRMSAAGQVRISQWVASKGEFYVNTKARAETDDEVDKDSAKDDAADLYALGANGKPAPRSVPLPPMASAVAAVGGGAKAAEDDAASEGGYSMAESQGGGGGGGQGGAEYKRGKRFRKLAKLMDSGQAQSMVHRFHRHAIITVAVLACVHIVCFALTVSSIGSKRTSMLHLSFSGDVQHLLARVMVNVRSMDLIYRNMTDPALFTRADLPEMAEEVRADAELIRSNMNQILAEYQQKDPLLMTMFFVHTIPVWSRYGDNGDDVFEEVVTWDAVDRLSSEAKLIYQNYTEWYDEGVDLAATTSGRYVLLTGAALAEPLHMVMDELVHAALVDTEHANELQLVFLAVEGAAITCVAACYVAWLLRAVAAQRYKLYGTFLAIPVGLTRALATQSTNLLDDDEDGEEEDDDDERAAVVADTQIGEGDEEDEEPAKAKRKLRVVGGEAAEGPVEAKPRRRASVNPAIPDPPVRGDTYGETELKDKGRTLSTASLLSLTGERTSCWSWLRRLFSRRSRVFPRERLMSEGGKAGGIEPAASSSRKRNLKYDSYQTLAMLSPFLLWSMLVIVFYAVAVVRVQGVAEIVAVQGVVTVNTARTYAAIFRAQELVAETDPAVLPFRRGDLHRAISMARDAFYTMILGDQAYKTLGPDTERFPLVTSGLSFASPQLMQLIFDNKACVRMEPHLPCPGPEWPFHQAVHAGVYSITQSFMRHCNNLVNNQTATAPELSSPDFEFIYQVGTKDLTDGNLRITDDHNLTIKLVFDHIMELHIALFLLMWVVFAGFIFVLLQPLLHRISKEKRRIAELMSQLPMELDVEKLVGRALGAIGNSSSSGAAGLHQAGAKQWGQILRSASMASTR